MKYQYALLVIFLLLITSYCFQRDIRIDNNYPVDLRNRIVGARLEMDGKSPYFYSWKPADGIRYYDPKAYNPDSLHVSLITASPFYHHLLSPIANLQQRTISRIWLAVEYVALIFCLILAFSFSKNNSQKWCIAFFYAMLLFTEGWLMHIAYGQSYIIIPLLSFLFLFCIKKNEKILFAFLAGFIAIMLLLIKPTIIFFFLPFIFFARRYMMRNVLIFMLPVIILAGYSFIDKKERNYWNDYERAISEHMKIHIGEKKTVSNDNANKYISWEGWNSDSIAKSNMMFPLKLHVEMCNIWLLAKTEFHQTISIKLINIILFAGISSLMIFFYVRQHPDGNAGISLIAIFGFCVYTFSEYLSPITRFEYYGVQMAFPLFLIAAYYDKKMLLIYILLFAGLLLNIFNIPFIKMRHTVGELIILFTLLWLCFSKKQKLVS
jgi:hypothetical protein